MTPAHLRPRPVIGSLDETEIKEPESDLDETPTRPLLNPPSTPQDSQTLGIGSETGAINLKEMHKHITVCEKLLQLESQGTPSCTPLGTPLGTPQGLQERNPNEQQVQVFALID